MASPESLQPNRSAAAPPPLVERLRRLPDRERVLALRRQFLVGGAATAGLVTLVNKSALAAGSQKCTYSTWVSQTPSYVLKPPCGDSASCWQNHDYSTWAPVPGTDPLTGAALSYTHNTTIGTGLSSGPANTGAASPVQYPLTESSKFSSGSSGILLSSLIEGSATFQVQMANRDWINFWTASEQSNICAALLNYEFYGKYYSASPVGDLINNTLNQVLTYAAANNSSGIASACTTLNTTLNTLNTQGETCDL